jgi:CxxC-x17-CxxC domain-containing protein
MASGILHFGQELSERFLFLKNAGFSIHRCATLVEFQDALQSETGPDAVSFSDLEEDTFPLVLPAARAHSFAPSILFRTRSLISFSAGGEPVDMPPAAEAEPAEVDFDLIVPASASPRVWVGSVAALIARGRALIRRSQSIREQSMRICEEAKVEGERFRAECERAQWQRTRPARWGPGWPTLGDRLLQCANCGMEFVFSAGEQLFFEQRHFVHDPKHCRKCRAELRSGIARIRRKTAVACAACGSSTVVPFKPTQGRPVLCRPCLQKQRLVS